MSRSAEESALQFRAFYESVSWPPEKGMIYSQIL